MATLGRPEFNNTGRITEHVQQQILIVTPDTYDKFDSSTTLAPKAGLQYFQSTDTKNKMSQTIFPY